MDGHSASLAGPGGATVCRVPLSHAQRRPGWLVPSTQPVHSQAAGAGRVRAGGGGLRLRLQSFGFCLKTVSSNQAKNGWLQNQAMNAVQISLEFKWLPGSFPRARHMPRKRDTAMTVTLSHHTTVCDGFNEAAATPWEGSSSKTIQTT